LVGNPITGKMPAGEESLEDLEARLLGNPNVKFDPEDTSGASHTGHEPPTTTTQDKDIARRQAEEDDIARRRGEDVSVDIGPDDPLPDDDIEEMKLSNETEELKMTEEDVIENEEYMDVSSEEEEEEIRLSETDLPTGQVERGEQSEVIVEGGKPRNKHDQISVPSGSNPTDVGKSTWNGETHGLDLSHENLEKAYQQFKAEQMEKLAYDDIKRSFQGRLNNELSVKKASVERNDYDAQAEVTELKKQFSELLDTLKNDAEMTIVKQQKVVNDLNIPSYEDISNMDWNEIHLTMQRLEERR
jgi:hypothetical protein